MEFQKLANHNHYYHTHSDFFHYSSDLVHAFLMDNYNIGMHEQEFYEISKNEVERLRAEFNESNDKVIATSG